MNFSVATQGVWSEAESRATPEVIPADSVLVAKPLTQDEHIAYWREADDRREREREACDRHLADLVKVLSTRDTPMTWKPSTADLELIAELGHARAPAAKIAAAVGIGEDEFRDWCQRLAAARTFGFPVLAAKGATPAAKRPEPSTEVDRLFAKP